MISQRRTGGTPMQKRRGGTGRYQPTSFYEPSNRKPPLWKFILPLLMILVIVGAVYMAYQDSLPENSGAPSSANVSGTMPTNE